MVDSGNAYKKRLRPPQFYATGFPHALLCDLWRQVEPRRVLASMRSPMSYYCSLFHFGRQQGKVNVDFPEFFANSNLRVQINWCCLYRYVNGGGLSVGGWGEHKKTMMRDAGLEDTWNQEPRVETLARLRDRYPDIPELRHPIGLMTFVLISFLFPDPVSVLSREPEDFNRFFAGGDWRRELPPIDFLDLDNLNRGLYDYLEQRGYHPSRTILKKPRTNVSVGDSFDPASLFGPAERRLLNERDWIVLRWFPHYSAAAAAGEAAVPHAHQPSMRTVDA